MRISDPDRVYELLPAFERHVGMSKARWQVIILLWREGELSQAVLQQRVPNA